MTPGHDGRHEPVEEVLEDLLQAAVEVEQETGHEETAAQAKRLLVLRVLRVGLGVVVLCVGITLLVLPGPGLIVMAAGLALMAQDVPFARRWLRRERDRIPEGEDGNPATWVIVGSAILFVSSVGGSLWWTFGR
jgi:hypothetical protein